MWSRQLDLGCNAWAKFKELSPILKARGASYKIKGKIFRAERIMRWMTGCVKCL